MRKKKHVQMPQEAQQNWDGGPGFLTSYQALSISHTTDILNIMYTCIHVHLEIASPVHMNTSVSKPLLSTDHVLCPVLTSSIYLTTIWRKQERYFFSILQMI